MVVPSTADVFRAAVRALRSLDMNDGVSFHSFTISEERCARIVVKNMGRGMAESVVREELESLNVCVQGVTQLRSERRDPDPAKDYLPTPHFIVSVAHGPEVSKVRSLTELCGLRMLVKSYLAPNVRCNASASSASATHSATEDMHIGASHVGAPNSPVAALPRGTGLCAVAAGETTQRATVAL